MINVRSARRRTRRGKQPSPKPAALLTVLVAVIVLGSSPIRAFAHDHDTSTPTPSPNSGTAPNQEAANGATPTTAAGAIPTSAIAAAEEPGPANNGATQALGAPTGTVGNRGMGDVDSQTGTSHARIPFHLPSARGQVQPSLGLAYSAGASNSEVGFGWSLALPVVERRNLSGGPKYVDPKPGQQLDPIAADRFEISGQPLVPICLVFSGQCTNGAALQPGEQLPTWASGWHYFRLLTDRAFVRYFWDGNMRWVAQAKDGSTAEFGLPLDDGRDDGGLDRDLSVKYPDTAESPVFRWKLTRQYGSTGKQNAIVYQWARLTENGNQTDGLSYLTDVYDTARVQDASLPPGEVPRTSYAHHTRLAYVRDFTGPAGVTLDNKSAIWRRRQGWRVDHVDVTSAPFQGGAHRKMVRRYSLDYDTSGQAYALVRTMLRRVRLYPACAGVEEGEDLRLPDNLGCGGEQTLAEMAYTAETGSIDVAKRTMEWDVDGGAGLVFADINGDAIPDAIGASTNARFPQKITFTDVFSGRGRTREMTIPQPALGADTSTLLASYKHTWLLGDWSGNGRLNALWFSYTLSTDPNNGLYTVYSGNEVHDTWEWLGGTTLGRIPQQIGFEPYYKRAPRVGDLDGDGLLDAFVVTGDDGDDPKNPEPRYWTQAFLSTRDAAGTITPFARPVKGPYGFNTSDTFKLAAESIVDLTGDGIPDFVRFFKIDDQDNFRWFVWKGRGDGTFDSVSSPFGPIVAHPGWSTHPEQWKFYLHDCNGDGLADKVTMSTSLTSGNGISIDWNDGTKFSGGVAWTGGTGVFTDSGRLEFVDFMGAGLDGVLYWDAHQAGAGAFYHFPGMNVKPGLLKTITNGLGATTTFNYDTTARLAQSAKWLSPIPTVSYVVTSTSTTAPGAGPDAGGARGVSYTYDNPLFDPVQRRFRGFQNVTTISENSAAANLVTEARFLVGDCADTAGPGNTCTASVDNLWEVLHGLPIETTTSNQSTSLSTAHQQYRIVKLYDGMDGRRVRTVYAQREDTWLYDTANFTAQPEDFNAPEIIADGIEFGDHTVKLAAGHGTAMAHRVSSMVRDGFGNVTSSTNYGVTDGGSGIETDRPVTQATTPILLPGFNGSNWTWRTADTYIKNESGATLRHRHADYDSFGQVQRTLSDLTGTLPLLRSHETGADTAPPPSDASQDGTAIVVSETTYDTFGNPKRTTEARGSKCADLVYDEAFAHLQTEEAVFTNGCGGSAALRTKRTYDRGLELITASVGPNGAVSMTTYDGFGRPTEQYAPDPEFGTLPEAAPSVKITYTDVPNGPYQRVRTERRDDDGSTAHYRSAVAYVNAYGQVAALVHEADPTAGDGAPFIVSGEARRDKAGAVVTAYEPRFIPFDPVNSLQPPAQDTGWPHRDFSYDAFRRLVSSTDLDGALSSKIAYHALAEDTFDPLDLADGATPHPTTSVTDGFGRLSLTYQTTTQSGTADTVVTRRTYATTGEVLSVVRSHSASSDTYVHNLKYDSWGRLVQNEEPNTSTGFGTPNVKAWRYAYNDAGEVVGTSDARGCGRNAFYDGAGRLLEEVYSPCLQGQDAYEVGRPTTRFLYDEPEADQTPGRPNARLWAGRLAASYDRGAHTQYYYDARGRSTAVRKQIAIPNEDNDPATEYATHWFRRELRYDAANRELASTTGIDVADLQGESVTVAGLTAKDMVTTSYTARGIGNQIGGSYGPLVTKVLADADGALREMQYGDEAHTTLTTDYNAQRLAERTLLRRSPPSIWTSPPTGYTPPPPKTTGQTVLSDQRFAYDAVDNPVTVGDARLVDEWPAGALPVSRALSYDDSYQLRRVDYAYSTGDDTQVSPYAAEVKARDIRPLPEGALSNRARWQTFDFDWQGNVVKTDDDAHAFVDRSTGTLAHGTPNNGPNRVTTAEAEKGHAHVTYDATGNVTRLQMTKPRSDGQAVDIDLTYSWDEVGHLVRVQREPIVIPGRLDVGLDVRYAYSGDQRVLKSVLDRKTITARHTVEVFPTLRLNDALFDDANDAQYERTAQTETGYLVSNGSVFARLAYEDTDVPTINGQRLHVYFIAPDALGSTSVVFDKASSELVERATYLAFGQPESDYRPERWKSLREDYRFTGKEDDTGTGLAYFGARYFVPAIGQWASADPLSVHSLGSDMNPYAYALGSPQRYIDPSGLASCDGWCLDNFSSQWGAFVDGAERGANGGPAVGGGGMFWFESSKTGLPGGEGIPVFVLVAQFRNEGVAQYADNSDQMAEVTVHGVRPSRRPGYFKVALEIAKVELCGPLTACGRGSSYLGHRYRDWFSSRQAMGDYFDKLGDKTFGAALQGLGTVLGGPLGGQAAGDLAPVAVNVVGNAAENWLSAVIPALLASWGQASTQPGKAPTPPKSSKSPHKHHVFPQEFEAWFKSKGINIHKYKVPLQGDDHLGQIHGMKIQTSAGPMEFKPGGIWNENWRAFKNANPGASVDEIMQFGREMCAGFGITSTGCP